MRAITVFCGSSPGNRPAHAQAATALGRAVAQAGMTLVYGGASVGLMGIVADAALAAGGRVIGVLPRSLADRELAHAGLTELHVVESMHARKQMMAELGDAFVALPGGIGTLEELFEIWTWALLGHHRKPAALLDADGFYQPLLRFLDQLVADGFVRPVHRDMLVVQPDAERMLAALATYRAPDVVKWVERGQT